MHQPVVLRGENRTMIRSVSTYLYLGFQPRPRQTRLHEPRSLEAGDILTHRVNGDSTSFQHHRRKRFPEDFARIRERLHEAHATAIYWHSLMFVVMSASIATIDKVRRINQTYASSRPVRVIE